MLSSIGTSLVGMGLGHGITYRLAATIRAARILWTKDDENGCDWWVLAIVNTPQTTSNPSVVATIRAARILWTKDDENGCNWWVLAIVNTPQTTSNPSVLGG